MQKVLGLHNFSIDETHFYPLVRGTTLFIARRTLCNSQKIKINGIPGLPPKKQLKTRVFITWDMQEVLWISESTKFLCLKHLFYPLRGGLAAFVDRRAMSHFKMATNIGIPVLTPKHSGIPVFSSQDMQGVLWLNKVSTHHIFVLPT